MDTKVVPLTNRQSTGSARVSLTSQLEEASRSLRARIILDQWRLPAAYERGKSPSIEEKTAVMATVSAIRSGLALSADFSDIEKAVRLLMGGMKVPVGLDPAGAAEAYVMCLETAKAGPLQVAVRNLMTGKAPERFSKTFLPSAPELSSYCAEVEKYLTALADRTEQILSLPEARSPRPEMTEEEMAERRKQIQTLVMAPFKGEPS